MQLISTIWPALLKGFATTLQLFFLVGVISIPLGYLIALIRVFGPRWLGIGIQIYIFIMRGTPLLLQLMFFFFGLPFAGITLSRFTAAVLAFSLNYAAYFAEIFRGGMLSVPENQYESIIVLGIGKVRGFFRIITPQVLRIVLPSLENEIISLVKDTSLVYILGIGELLRAGQIAANTYVSLTPFLGVAVLYLAVTGFITFILQIFEVKNE